MTQAKQFTCLCCGNQSDHLEYEEQTTRWQYFGDTGDFIDENEYEWDKTDSFSIVHGALKSLPHRKTRLNNFSNQKQKLKTLNPSLLSIGFIQWAG